MAKKMHKNNNRKRAQELFKIVEYNLKIEKIIKEVWMREIMAETLEHNNYSCNL